MTKVGNVRPFLISVLALSLAAAIVAGLYVLQAHHKYSDLVELAGRQERIPLKDAPIKPSWIISGSPICGSLDFGTSFDDTARGGIWQCEGPAQFNWHYTNDESVYILEGAAEVEYLGRKILLEVGSSTLFVSGTTAVWTVPQRVRKTFLIHNPGSLVKRVSRLTD